MDRVIFDAAVANHQISGGVDYHAAPAAETAPDIRRLIDRLAASTAESPACAPDRDNRRLVPYDWLSEYRDYIRSRADGFGKVSDEIVSLRESGDLGTCVQRVLLLDGSTAAAVVSTGGVGQTGRLSGRAVPDGSPGHCYVRHPADCWVAERCSSHG
jgi:hypothetical protein